MEKVLWKIKLAELVRIMNFFIYINFYVYVYYIKYNIILDDIILFYE